MTIAIIGRGLIGSAAARHLAKSGHAVALIGPGEPADFARHDGVFASHYDEGRITRILDASPVWTALNRAAIARYGEIAAESGIAFYTEIGALHLGPADGADIAAIGRVAAEAGIPCEACDAAALAERFPYLAVAPGDTAWFEPRNAGHVSPRRLVRAQTIAAERAAARVIDAIVLGLSETRSGVTIRTTAGEIAAERVLVAAGGHTQSLLGRSLDHAVFARTIALFRLDPAEVQRLAGMPSMRCFGPQGANPYILPPIRYPDDAFWIKLGGDPVDIRLEGDADIRAWFRSGGSSAVADGLEAQIRDRIPGLAVEERRVMPCMTTFTRSNLPCIGPLSERVAIATAGCGAAAKCSDELGRLGAMALLGEVRAEFAP